MVVQSKKNPVVYAEVAQRKSTVLIRRGSRFRNSPSVPVFGEYLPTEWQAFCLECLLQTKKQVRFLYSPPVLG